MKTGIHNFARAGFPAAAPGAAGALLLSGGGLACAAAPLGWRGQAIAFSLYGLTGFAVLLGLAGHAPHRRFGLANGVTLARAAAAALLLGMWGEAASGGIALGATLRWLTAGLGALALASDGIDGWLARRRGLASAFGARFDMESDALLVLALALLVHAAGQAGAYVLLSGALRYLFVAAGWPVPALRAPLPPSRRRKIVCVVQTGILLLALSPLVPAALGAVGCGLGLALLVYSFAVDIALLLTRRGSHIMP